MDLCRSCEGFVPAGLTACPCCQAIVRPASRGRGRRILRGAAALAGSTAFAMTLSACYGGAIGDPYFPSTDSGSPFCNDLARDLDGDDHCGIYDCDEDDPDVNSSATDVPGDGIDQDCSGADSPVSD